MDLFEKIGAVVAIVFIVFFEGSFTMFGVYYLIVCRTVVRTSFLKRRSYLVSHGRGGDIAENESILGRDLKTRILSLRITTACLAVAYLFFVVDLCLRLAAIDMAIGFFLGFSMSLCYSYSVIEEQEKQSPCVIGRVISIDSNELTALVEYGAEPFRHQFDLRDNPKLVKRLKVGKTYYFADYTWSPMARACNPDEWEGRKLPDG